MDAHECHRIVDAVGRFFTLHREGVLAAYVFGSVARGEAAAGSDVDVAVLLSSESPRTLEGLRPDLRDGLAEHLGRRVDVVVLNHAPADLVHRVLRDGILALDTKPAIRRTFEVRRRNEFFDLEPVRRQYRRHASTGAAAS